MLWGCALGLSSYRAPQDAQTPGGGSLLGMGPRRAPTAPKGSGTTPTQRRFPVPPRLVLCGQRGPQSAVLSFLTPVWILNC